MEKNIATHVPWEDTVSFSIGGDAAENGSNVTPPEGGVETMDDMGPVEVYENRMHQTDKVTFQN